MASSSSAVRMRVIPSAGRDVPATSGHPERGQGSFPRRDTPRPSRAPWASGHSARVLRRPDPRRCRGSDREGGPERGRSCRRRYRRSDRVRAPFGDDAAVVAQNAAKVAGLRAIAQDSAGPITNLAVTRLGHWHRHDPSSNELLGISRVGPFGEFFRSQQGGRGHRCRGHGTLRRLLVYLNYRIPRVPLQANPNVKKGTSFRCRGIGKRCRPWYCDR